MSALRDGYRLVPVPESRGGELEEVDELAFAMTTAPETRALVPMPFEWDRARAVERADGRLAAVHASYEFTLPTPGGSVACSGLTWVCVRPDERRRGLLSAMIADHFERSLARGEVVSALTASEPAIYGRFGYGCAAQNLRLTLPRRAALRDVPGSDELTVRIDTLDRERHEELVARLHRAAGAGRPGWITRDTDKLRIRPVVDPPAWRDGGEPMRIATVHDASGEARGYALLRRKDVWADAGPRYTVALREAAAVDAAATHRLWSFLLDLDLTSEVTSGQLAPDETLLQLLVDVRATTPRVSDNVWVRILDVPAALSQRRYSAPLDLVLDVTDVLLPSNARRWRLTTGDAVDGSYPAQVTPTDDDADLTIDVRELGAAYLGGRSLAALTAAGLVVERTPGAASTAATAFGWPVAPVCSWVF